MKYKGIALDMDEVLVDTIDAVVSILNEDYNLNVEPKNVKRWDFKDVYPQLTDKQINSVWNDERLFEILKFKPDTLEVLNDLNNNYKVIIFTQGSHMNLKLKENFLLNHNIDIPIFGAVEGISDKSELNLKDWIFVDDNQNNLDISNASCKILFENRENADWNNHWSGNRIKNLKEIYKYLKEE